MSVEEDGNAFTELQGAHLEQARALAAQLERDAQELRARATNVRERALTTVLAEILGVAAAGLDPLRLGEEVSKRLDEKKKAIKLAFRPGQTFPPVRWAFTDPPEAKSVKAKRGEPRRGNKAKARA